MREGKGSLLLISFNFIHRLLVGNNPLFIIELTTFNTICTDSSIANASASERLEEEIDDATFVIESINGNKSD